MPAQDAPASLLVDLDALKEGTHHRDEVLRLLEDRVVATAFAAKKPAHLLDERNGYDHVDLEEVQGRRARLASWRSM